MKKKTQARNKAKPAKAEALVGPAAAPGGMARVVRRVLSLDPSRPIPKVLKKELESCGIFNELLSDPEMRESLARDHRNKMLDRLLGELTPGMIVSFEETTGGETNLRLGGIEKVDKRRRRVAVRNGEVCFEVGPEAIKGVLVDPVALLGMGD